MCSCHRKPALQPNLKRPTPLAPVPGDKTRIAPLSPPAKTKTLSAFHRQSPHFFNDDKRLAESAVDLMEASFFRGFDPVNGLRPP
jgi:hypothetical protein